MNEILKFIGSTSGTSFLFLCIFLFIGLFVNQVFGKGDVWYAVLVATLTVVIYYKIQTTYSGIQERYYLHIKEFIAFPLSLSMVVLIRKIKFTRKKLDILTYVLMFIQLMNITRFSLLNLALPQYNTTFSLAAALMGFYGAWLLMHNLFRKRAIFIILVSFFCIIISLIKWQLILLPLFTLILFFYALDKFSFATKVIVGGFIGIIFLSVLYVGRDSIIKNVSGYSSFDDYYSVRISKDNQQGTIGGKDVYNNVGIVADGGRFFIWSFHIAGWLDGNQYTGVDLNFTNPFTYPEHNVFIFYITRFGLFTLAIIFFTRIYFKNNTLIYKKNKMIYICLLLYILMLFSVGGWYGVPRACLLLSITVGLYQNELRSLYTIKQPSLLST